MAKGVRRSIDERIEAKKSEVGKAQVRLKTLQTELKELETEKQQMLSVALADAAEEAGLSLEEAIKKIRSK